MSVWDSISSGWDWAKKTGTTIGGAFSAVQHKIVETPILGNAYQYVNPSVLITDPVARDQTVQAIDTIKSGVGNVFDLAGKGDGFLRGVPVAGSIYGAGADAVSAPIDLINQGIDYATRGIDTALMTENPFDSTDWRNSWNKSKTISFGQTVNILWNQSFGDTRPGISDFSMDPDAVKARQDYYQGTSEGKLRSGIIDAILAWRNPLGKAVEGTNAAVQARSTFADATEIDNALKIQRGETVARATRRENRFAAQVDDLARNGTNGTAEQMWADPYFKNSGSVGGIVPILADANKIADEAERVAFKSDVLGAAYGNAAARERLAQRRPDIMAEIDNFGKPPMSNLDVAAGPDYFGDANTPVVKANPPDAPLTPEMQAAKAEVEAKLRRLDTFIDSEGFGSITRTKSRWGEQLAARVINSDIVGGIGTRPIRVITTSLANKVPGGVAVKDPTTGYGELQTMLKQSYWTSREKSSLFLNRFAAAGNPQERSAVVQDAVAQVNRDIAARYGVPPETADYILAHGTDEAKGFKAQAKSRLYSSAEEAKMIELTDPTTGAVFAIPRPLMKSQIEDYEMMPNPRQLDNAYRSLTKSRMIDHITVGEKTDAVMGTLAQVGNDALNIMTQVWKNAQLMQLRYPARIQVDSQLRNALYMGTAAYTMGAVHTLQAASGKKYIVNALWSKGGDRVPLKDIFKGDTDKFINNYLKLNGVAPEDVEQLRLAIQTNGGDLSAMMLGTADHLEAKYKATGNWTHIEYGQPGHTPAYLRAVNEQIRNSPTAIAMLSGKTSEELAAFIKQDGAARAEWQDLKPGFGHDQEMWLDKLESHLNHYLPTPEAQATAWSRRITKEDLEKWYPNGDGPRVHGESYSPLDRNSPAWRLIANATKGRDWFYKVASDAPETALARTQLYTYEFNKQMTRITENVLKENAAIDPKVLTNIRNTADRLARKAVGDTLFNTAHTSNLAYSFRHYSPFFAAWEDTMKKYAGILYDKPWAAVRLAQAWNYPNEHGWVHDENGNAINGNGQIIAPNGKILDPNNQADARLIGRDQRMSIPLEWLPKSMRANGHVTELTLSKNSLNLVFQGDPWWLPGTGPLVQFPVNELVKNYFQNQEKNPLVKLVLPYGVQNKDGSWADDLVAQNLPSYVKDGWDTLTHGPKWAENYKNAIAMQQSEIDSGKRKVLDTEAAQHQAMLMGIMQAASDNASPVRIKPTADSQFYIDMYHSLKGQYPQMADPTVLKQYTDAHGDQLGKLLYTQDHPDADTVFLQQYPDFYALSASLSANETGIVATLKAVDTYKQVKPLVDAKPEFGWAFIGPDNQYGLTNDTAFSQAANDYLKLNDARGGRSPVDAVNQAEISKGWLIYNQGMTQLRLTLEGRGLASFSAKGASDLQDLKKKFEDQLSQDNPVWGRDFGQTDGKKAIDLLRSIQTALVSKPDLAKRGDMQAYQQYIQGRQFMQEQLAARKFGTLSAKANADLAQRWDAFTAQLVQENIGFEMAFNRVLQRDDLQGSI